MHNRFKLPSNTKLSTTHQFNRVFGENQKFYGKFWILFSASNNLSHPRLGLAISKKTSNLAVVRNRLKRICREHFRLQQTTINQVDIIIVAKKHCVRQSSDVLYSDLKNLFNKLSSNNKATN